MMRKNSEYHPAGTTEPFRGGTIPPPKIGNIFLRSKSGLNKIDKNEDWHYEQKVQTIEQVSPILLFHLARKCTK